MADERLEELLRLTLERTKSQRLNWEAVGQEGIAFAVRLQAANLVVDSVDEDGAPPYRLAVFRLAEEGGDLLAQIEQESPPGSRGGDYDHSELETLYALARNKAMNVGPVLESVIADLKRLDAPESPLIA